jgi:hypothetical protein
MAAPAATVLSPVARDYPSRAFGGFFIPPRLDVLTIMLWLDLFTLFLFIYFILFLK